jgi:hypothetical protein
MGHARELLKSVLIIVVVVGLTGAIAKADSISVISGTLGTSSYVNVSGTISAGDGTVTIALSNNLTNSQVISIGQNISGIYFQVSGSSGQLSLTSSSSFASTSISNGTGTLLGGVNPTGWISGSSGGYSYVCVICPGGNAPGGPGLTIVGGTGSGAYANANGSIDNNVPHNPLLVGPVTFTLSAPGVTAGSQFSNVIVQFGTQATPPVQVPEGASLPMMVLAGATILGGIGNRFRRT